jgi:excisionase family DNA binding protein
MTGMSTVLDEKTFLSVADVARVLSLGVTYTRRLINRGEIKSVRVGKRVLVPRHYLDDYVSALLEADQSA